MAVTAAQIRAGKAQLLDRVWVRYPAMRPEILRVLLQLYRQGDATDREVARAILDDAFQAARGRALDHEAHHLLAEALSVPDAATPGIDRTDMLGILQGIA